MQSRQKTQTGEIKSRTTLYPGPGPTGQEMSKTIPKFLSCRTNRHGLPLWVLDICDSELSRSSLTHHGLCDVVEHDPHLVRVMVSRLFVVIVLPNKTLTYFQYYWTISKKKQWNLNQKHFLTGFQKMQLKISSVCGQRGERLRYAGSDPLNFLLINIRGPFYWHDLTEIGAWISNYIIVLYGMLLPMHA